MRKFRLPGGRTTLLLAIAAVLLAFAAAGCATKTSSKGRPEGQAKEVAQQESKDKETKVLRTDVSEKQAIVDAAAKIDELRKAEAPNYAEIENIFVSELKEMVGKRDAESGATLVADIEKAIVAAKSGTDVTLNGQRISKTLIRAFYLAVKHEFEEAEGVFADKTEEGVFHKWDEAEAYFGGLKGSGYLKDNVELITRIEEAFEQGREAIAGDNLLEMKLAAQVVDKISIRFFVGSVLVEADEAKSEPAKAQEKIVEGRVFYSAVADKFKDYDGQISAALGSVETANPDTLRALFAQGLADKVIHESEEVAVNWGTDKAAVVAREAGLYMETMQEVVGAKQVGDVGAIRDQLLRLEAAVSASDKTEAARLANEIIEAVKSVKTSL